MQGTSSAVWNPDCGEEDTVRDTTERVMLPVVEGAHATRRWGLRFVGDEIEAAYRAWFVEQAVPFTRIGTLVSAFGWLFAVVITGI